MHKSYTAAQAFKTKLLLTSNQVLKNKFTHSSTLGRMFMGYSATKKWSNIHNNIQLLACPCSSDTERLQIMFSWYRLICSDRGLREKFNSVKCASFFELLSDPKYINFEDSENNVTIFWGSHKTVNKCFLWRSWRDKINNKDNRWTFSCSSVHWNVKIYIKYLKTCQLL